jgi:hypothetical protein
MNPLTHPAANALAELRVLVANTEAKAAGLDTGACRFVDLEDLRSGFMGELFDLLDRIDIGLGTRAMLALYPRADAQLCGDARRPARRAA